MSFYRFFYAESIASIRIEIGAPMAPFYNISTSYESVTIKATNMYETFGFMLGG